VVKAYPYPNPDPSRIAVLLNGGASSVTVKIYGKSLVLFDEFQSGPLPSGWSSIALPPAFLNRAAAGTYYFKISLTGAKGVVGRMVILR
jgi:hypothetical protein